MIRMKQRRCKESPEFWRDSKYLDLHSFKTGHFKTSRVSGSKCMYICSYLAIIIICIASGIFPSAIMDISVLEQKGLT